ncbi:exodeoxyribonuclease III [Companilactobacillus sp.]|jgi:exodeoxyribonuclease-3|uniref:exodeoxyribonuclease III n=1 Tax=Companilactobacillus sp. TaxID=2767905 RepID=UPI0025BFB269|nr:exodeoxyribonuclease III [Companilactobacillus sp.]MCH4008751.1 exodeoxyribonuclease III [Companilactobacillus sp.]MCH4051070.1 exodeoxyribonuclease III [Companilactobacillus sp.]MCH4076694.1 exodeoxyribonuclease III [Companilactobacillus sp.]MCH4125269.1 exodeoxyribonuclease III [Companilactobacillus sp.]MCH4131809.1 exodeoxyribonuclease III [Companilactobacillus sp.]
MKLISWNVNGLRAVVKHDFKETFDKLDADAFCIQETKLQEGQIDLDLPGYHQYFNYADRKGYSGTAIFTKEEPISVKMGLDVDEYNHEGRTITLEYPKFYLITSYTPNSQQKLKRIDFRMGYDDVLRQYMQELSKKKPVVLCGDLNVAHNEIDIKNDKTNHHNPGFSDQERAKFSELLDSGFTDSFRYLHPDEVKYSWWSYRFNARQNNAGWRIDYFVVSNNGQKMIKNADILTDVYGSDHCPVQLDLDLEGE